jgi:hypothetical protein
MTDKIPIGALLAGAYWFVLLPLAIPASCAYEHYIGWPQATQALVDQTNACAMFADCPLGEGIDTASADLALARLIERTKVMGEANAEAACADVPQINPGRFDHAMCMKEMIGNDQ